MRIPRLYPQRLYFNSFVVGSGICMFNKHSGDSNAGDCNAGQTQNTLGEILLINSSPGRVV